MNAPTPVSPPSDAPASASVTRRATVTILPTTGSVLGSVLGVYVASLMHVTDPISEASLIAGCTALLTALSHWIGTQVGANIQ